MSFSLKSNIQFDNSNLSAFGTLETDQLTPLVQMDFVYGINNQTGVATPTNSATVDTSSSRLRLQSGTNSAGSAIFDSRKLIKYRPGQGITARFTAVWANNAVNNTHIYGAGNTTDGYFFGYNGTSFSILHRNAGVNTWIPQSSWNGDKCDGTGASQFTWDTTKGNVVMIKYPYLGYGDINFFVLDGTPSRFILVHTIKYSNSSASVQLSNPSLNFHCENINSGNTTNIIGYVGSVGVFLSGRRSFTANPKGAANVTKTITTSEANVISIRNATSYNGKTNRGTIRLNFISLGISSNQTVTLLFKIGATVGGTPSFTPYSGTTGNNGVTITSGNSVASTDTAGTTIAGGVYVFNLSVGSTGTTAIDLTPLELFIAPGETMSISGIASGNAVSALSVNWSEDI